MDESVESVNPKLDFADHCYDMRRFTDLIKMTGYYSQQSLS